MERPPSINVAFVVDQKPYNQPFLGPPVASIQSLASKDGCSNSHYKFDELFVQMSNLFQFQLKIHGDLLAT